MTDMEGKGAKLGRPFKVPGEKATKEKIIDAAIDLFSSSGYNGTSIRKIAKAVGLTEGALYRHFAGKEAILEAIFASTQEFVYTPLPIEESLGENPEQSVFRGLLEPLPALIQENPDVIKVMRILYIELPHNENIRQFFQHEFTERAIDHLESMFAKCIEKGTIKSCDPRALAITFNAYRSDWSFNNYMVNYSDENDLEKIQQKLDRVIDFFEHTFLP